MTRIAVRGYTRKSKPSNQVYIPFPDPPLRHNRILVFDTETTVDQCQNLKIGYFRIYQDGILQHDGLFYCPSELDENEIIITQNYGNNTNYDENLIVNNDVNYANVNDDKNVNNYENYVNVNDDQIIYDHHNYANVNDDKNSKPKIAVYSLEEFIEEVFYPEIYGLKTLCVGFNLAFDISRLALDYGLSRKHNKGGFTFYLSQNSFHPPLIIKKMGDSHSFKFSTTKNNLRENYFSGHFLDIQTIANVLLQKRRISLDKAGEVLGTDNRKTKGIEHGRVTEKYIDYLVQDVKTTYDVYQKLVLELDNYQINIPITKLYSSASLAKHALSQLGIEPFLLKNPDFSPELLGRIMTAYYGGRVECRCRKPVKVTTLDFTSMYPTVTMLLGLWPFIIAESIESEDATEEVRELLEIVNPEYLQKKENWERFNVLVQIIPDNDILPVRADYKGNNQSLNVGLNHLKSDKNLWYALPDVITSKILTGKTPKVISAIRFTPKGIQKGLKNTEILGVKINPKKDSLTQLLVEERQKIKENPELKNRAQAMKILVNAMSYGIFIELNPADKKTGLDVFGLSEFKTDKNRPERTGTFFNPLLAVLITSGSRLMLAIIEAVLTKIGGKHAYMDTDSIFVHPKYADDLVDFCQPLNPYNVDIHPLKVEKTNVLFYGISSKRYVLYRSENDNFDLIDYKLHGLGHLKNPFGNYVSDWQAEIWQDILKLKYEYLTEQDIEEKYCNLYAITQMTVSTSNLMKRFNVLNEDREYRKQIKPFNFFLLGFQAKKDGKKSVKPLAPFSKNSQSIVHEPFIDYETGIWKSGLEYFKPLSKTILEYVEHPEYKFEGDTGYLERKRIFASAVFHIGKEANNIDEQAIGVKKPQEFWGEEDWKKYIFDMSYSEAEKMGIHRNTLKYWRKKLK